MIHHHLSVTEQIQYFENISYVGVFAIVLLSGYIVPLPEDIILPLVGYIAALGFVRLTFVTILSVVSIVLADFLLYYLSLTGKKVAIKLEAKIKASLFKWYIDMMTRHTFFVMFFSRFVPGLRFINPLVAGFVKISPAKFSLYTIVSASMYVPIMIFLGYFLSAHIAPLLTAVESVRHILIIAILVIVGVTIAFFVNKKFFSQK
jgi:membrane protein DedA with SNARE-associated domain